MIQQTHVSYLSFLFNPDTALEKPFQELMIFTIIINKCDEIYIIIIHGSHMHYNVSLRYIATCTDGDSQKLQTCKA